MDSPTNTPDLCVPSSFRVVMTTEGEVNRLTFSFLASSEGLFDSSIYLEHPNLINHDMMLPAKFSTGEKAIMVISDKRVHFAIVVGRLSYSLFYQNPDTAVLFAHKWVHIINRFLAQNPEYIRDGGFCYIDVPRVTLVEVFRVMMGSENNIDD